ncbi:unnamed protein product, partial [Effrenium voratum]
MWAGGRLLVGFPDGQQKSVRPENLCPMNLELVDAQPEATDAEEVPAALAAPKALGRLRVDPPRIPCSGGEVRITAEGLDGPVAEVLVNGALCELEGDVVQVPPCDVLLSGGGIAELEVRTGSWTRHVIREKAVKYFPVVSFTVCSPNVELSSSSGKDLDVATRRKGLINAVALTSDLSPVDTNRYYFEVRVETTAEKRTNRTLALGFAWHLPHALLMNEHDSPSYLRRRASVWSLDGHMPENASGLPRSLILGGDPPKAYLGGKEIAKLSWRPLLECALGTVLGLALDMEEDKLRVSVYQDGAQKCVVEAPVPEDWTWPGLGAPNGVLDVCGGVTSVALCQGEAPSREASADAEEKK